MNSGNSKNACRERVLECEDRLGDTTQVPCRRHPGPQRPARVDSLLVPDVWCVPTYVVEIQADEITQSPMHTAGREPEGHLGYALRFPRIAHIRDDKTVEQISTIDEVRRIYEGQLKREKGS